MVKFPAFINSIVSKLNVEKVLNPPQKPIKKNTFKFEVEIIFSLNIMIKMERIIQLIKLEHNVAIGKINLKFALTNSPILYLKMLPNPPPVNTNNKLFICKLI